MSARSALEEFIAATIKSYPDLVAPFDAQWRSTCELGEPFERNDNSLIAWQPLARAPQTASTDFAPLERALELTVHADIKDYYSAFWSAGLEAEAIDGHVSLLFLWNPDDVARLNENLIGHAMAKQRTRSPLSIFFACTEANSELFLSIDNDSGAVLLEKPGSRPIRQVADDLASFLQTLVPRPPELHP